MDSKLVVLALLSIIGFFNVKVEQEPMKQMQSMVVIT